MSRQPTAPRPHIRLCRICSRPDYLEGLCYRHYKLKDHPAIKDYPDRQQDADVARYENAKPCGCPLYPADHHGWTCRDNPFAEVGDEHISEVDV